MKNYLKYLPWLITVICFFIGRISSPKPDKDLIRKYELERETLLADNKAKERLILTLSNQDKEIRAKMTKDSLENIKALTANKAVILKLKKDYEKISFRNASASELDSLLSALYPD